MPRPKPDVPTRKLSVRVAETGHAHIERLAEQRTLAEGRPVTTSEVTRRMMHYAATHMPPDYLAPPPPAKATRVSAPRPPAPVKRPRRRPAAEVAA